MPPVYENSTNPLSRGRVAAVLLNYNSENDLRICAEQLAKQQGVDLVTILVDNASRASSRAAVRSWLKAWCPAAVCGSDESVSEWVAQNPDVAGAPGRVFLIENSVNRGYSAGNNVGLRLAVRLGADAALIANPDMRIEDPLYVQELHRHLREDRSRCIAASRIIDLEGRDQNPLREPTFTEELLWPRWLLIRWFKQATYVLTSTSRAPREVPKVSGCCLLLCTEFIHQDGYLDENVFLYCEEPILAARARAAKRALVYVPTTEAVHAHVAAAKGSSSHRMQTFIKSRLYYLRRYSAYNSFELSLLFLSYACLNLQYRLRAKVERCG